MSLILDRRSLLKAASLGIGVAATPAFSALANARGFTHNVASGEPRQQSVLLWTRYVAASGGDTRLGVEVSDSADFGRIVARAEGDALGASDSCAKVMIEGLTPGSWYFYRFRAPDGTMSPVGRTRTLPDGPTRKFTLGVFSCSNLPFGWFNAYGHAAARDDIDLMVHLGDYLYEYERGKYPAAADALAGRIIDPSTEILALSDYRMRFASYRADPDLQRLHQLFPMVAMWDDHEIANDAWTGGAQNHQPETEGDWAARRDAALKAYREWMPVSDRVSESYEIGDLATIIRPETRITGRSQQLNLAQALGGQSDVRAALLAFRDGPWSDPKRSILGEAQEKWVADELRRSVSSGTRWQVLAQQLLVGSVSLPPESKDWIRPEASAEVKQGAAVGLMAASIGLPFNFDMWGGYPAARRRLLSSALDANANLIVLAGDSHNAWAFDLAVDGKPAGVEFGGTSVTSPGYESYLPWVKPEVMARAIVGANPELKWADMSRRGYMTVELTPDTARGEWLFVDTIRQRSTALSGRDAMSVARGSNRLA